MYLVSRISRLGQIFGQSGRGNQNLGLLALQFADKLFEFGSAVGVEAGVEKIDQNGGVEYKHLFIPPQRLEFGLGVFHGVPLAALDGTQGGDDFSQWHFVQSLEALYVESIQFPGAFLRAAPFTSAGDADGVAEKMAGQHSRHVHGRVAA